MEVSTNKILQKNWQEIWDQYNDLLHTNRYASDKLLPRLQNIEKTLNNIYVNYILSFGNHVVWKGKSNFVMQDEYKPKFLRAILVQDIRKDDWEKLSEEQKNAFAQYSKKEQLELWENFKKICHLLNSIALENYDRRKNRVKACLIQMKSLMENEKNKLKRKMSELNPSISSSSYSDQEEPPEGEITYANPKLKKIPPGRDPLLELISKETV